MHLKAWLRKEEKDDKEYKEYKAHYYPPRILKQKNIIYFYIYLFLYLYMKLTYSFLMILTDILYAAYVYFLLEYIDEDKTGLR